MKTLDYERYVFQLIRQEQSELFASFVQRLWNQVDKCKFTDPDFHIKDQIIGKCISNELRQKAFEVEMTLDQLIFTGKTLEAAEKNSRSETSRSTQTQFRECSRCGFSDHTYFELSCPAIKARCEFCKKSGHYARMCRKNLRKRSHSLSFEDKIPSREPMGKEKVYHPCSGAGCVTSTSKNIRAKKIEKSLQHSLSEVREVIKEPDAPIDVEIPIKEKDCCF